MSRAMIGVDIGAHQIKLVQWDGHQVVRAAAVPTPEELVKESQITDYKAMADLIRSTLREAHIHGRSCAIIIPSRFCYLRRITVPAMTVDQLLVNLPFEFRDFLVEDKSQYFFDYALNRLIPDEEGQPSQMDLTACAVPKQLIEDYRDMLHRAGLKLRTAIPVECAYVNLIRRHLAPNPAPQPKGEETPPSEEFCIVDLGHMGTRIHIFQGDLFENTRECDTGLAGLIRIVSSDNGVETEVARDRVYTNENGVWSLPDAQDLYTSISNDVRKTVNFYEFNHRESDIRTLWCCGSGVRVEPLPETLRQVLGLEVRTVESLMPPAAQVEAPSIYAAAVGAAIQ